MLPFGREVCCEANRSQHKVRIFAVDVERRIRCPHRRMRRGGGAGGAAALPNSGKTVGKIRAKQEEKIG